MKEKNKSGKNSRIYYLFLQPIMQILDQVYLHNERSIPKEKLKIYSNFINNYYDFVQDNIIPLKTYSKTEFNAMELFYINIIKHLPKENRITFSQYSPKMLHLQKECSGINSISSHEETASKGRNQVRIGSPPCIQSLLSLAIPP